MTVNIESLFGTMPSPELSRHMQRLGLRAPRLPGRPLNYGDRGELAALLTGAVVIGKDGNGDHFLAEVHPERSTVFRLVAGTGMLEPHSTTLRGHLRPPRRPSRGRPDVLVRYAHARWLIKLLVGLPFDYTPRQRASETPMDALHDHLERLITGRGKVDVPRGSPPLLRLFTKTARESVTLWRRRFRENQAIVARQQTPEPPKPVVDHAATLRAALAKVKKTSRKAKNLAARFSDQPTHTELLDELCYELWTLEAWGPMLLVAELSLEIQDAGYYPRFQKGLALMKLGKLDESLAALVDAQRWYAAHDGIRDAIAAVRAGLRARK